MNKMNKKMLGILVLTVMALTTGAYYYLASPQLANGGLDYQTATLSRGNIESVVNAAGTINPVVTVDVGSEVSGTIAELRADFNSVVKKGDVIAQLDDRTVLSKLTQNQADLAAARASLEQQKANISSAKANLNLNKTEYERLKPLVARGLISRSELDKAKAAYEVSVAQVQQADSQVIASNAQIAQKQAVLQQTQLDLDRTTIRSPLDGVVIDRQVSIGQTVAASLSAPILFKIAQDLSQMQIEADVDEADIGKIREKQPVRFTVDAYPERKFSGEVAQVRKASTVNNNVVTYKVVIRAANEDKALLPGMTANVDMVIGLKENVLRVPNAALRFKPATGTAVAAQSGGNNMAQRMQETFAKLQLSADQQKQVDTVLAEFQASMETVRNSAGAGGFGPNAREQMAPLRQKMNNSLKSILSEAQYAQYEAASAQTGGNRRPANGSNNTDANFTRGELWSLQDGKPTALRVRVGLSNDEFSEIQGQNIDETTAVIVRANRRTP
jgi:HlyD family secretion protein